MSNCSAHDIFMNECIFILDLKVESKNTSEAPTIYTEVKETTKIPCTDHEIMNGQCFDDKIETESLWVFPVKCMFLLITVFLLWGILLKFRKKNQQQNIIIFLI